MNNKICDRCGTENDIKFQYCINCGYEFKTNVQESTTYSNQNINTPEIDYIDGIETQDIIAFTVKNPADIVKKYQKMLLSNSKISWCWPASILGLLFGPLGSAIWFFYRKMYKNAIILSVIGAIASIITGILTFYSNPIDYRGLFQALESGSLTAFLNGLDNAEITSNIYTLLAEVINELLCLASGILCGLFGFYLYKKHTVEKIKEYRENISDHRYYKLGLSTIGGVSSGMIALGIIINVAVEYIVSAVSIIISMFN